VTRYEGKPLLRLLELYVLWSIDRLPSDLGDKLEAMTPKLRETWNCDGTWQDCIAAAMAFPATMPKLIRERWSHNQELAARAGEQLDPNDFAVMFVDSNFDAPDA
jgi:hypothetical protein